MWWEVRPLIRFFSAGKCGKEVEAGEEVGGEGSVLVGKRVVEVDEGSRLWFRLPTGCGGR